MPSSSCTGLVVGSLALSLARVWSVRQRVSTGTASAAEAVDAIASLLQQHGKELGLAQNVYSRQRDHAQSETIVLWNRIVLSERGACGLCSASAPCFRTWGIFVLVVLLERGVCLCFQDAERREPQKRSRSCNI